MKDSTMETSTDSEGDSPDWVRPVRDPSIAILVAGVLLGPSLLAGCVSDTPSWRVRYLGEDVQEPAHPIEEGELREEAPELADAMESARQQGSGSTVYVDDRNANEAATEYIEREAREDCHDFNCNPYQGRVNWTGSMFRLSGIMS